MSKKNLYLVLCVVGVALPLWQLGSFVSAEGWNVPLFFTSLFVNGASGMFTVDLLISSLAFWVWMLDDSKKHGVGLAWIVIFLNLSVGLSLALPLYFWLRTRRLEEALR